MIFLILRFIRMEITLHKNICKTCVNKNIKKCQKKCKILTFLRNLTKKGGNQKYSGNKYSEGRKMVI